MIDLNKEAEEYSNSQIEYKPHYSLTNSFIAGANSKFVQQQLIQAQLDCLNKAKDLDILTVYIQLQKKLKQLWENY